ncbi:MAG: hypothetical protein HOL66_05395 [Rhodospirillaceae bacterium]|jgi:hypothetical protein|nr:hypothetical protein [Rhodospirillaceae bacterium]MBT5243658.1 hypothetical protein [Rhodospirillaceae bacterium]MBT5561962.1 hypothetical protein [Rhodospirillaceae bacterium]MBT6240415.1 hypothetical protein [Rhodospirillaceae bacterium]
MNLVEKPSNFNPDQPLTKADSHSPTVMPVATGRRPTTKTIGKNADGVLAVIQGFEKQWKWRLSFRDVPDIQSLFEVLEEDSKNPKAAVVRGALRGHVDPDGIIHLRKDVSRWGDTAHFEECPRNWLMIDIDKQPLDGIDLINTPVKTVKRAIGKFLPDCYQDVSFVWQLSSSAGLKDDGLLSIHIWFILDRPVWQDELKTYHVLKAPAVDPRPFQTVQVHYIAAPIFEDGIKDHLSKRIGLVRLDKAEVSLPVLPPEAVASAYRTIGKGPTGSVHGFEEKLKFLGDGEGLSRFHDVLIAAASSYVYGKFEWEIDTEWLKARLRDAINNAPKHAGRTNIPHYLSDGYLDQNIDTAMSKFCQAVTTPKYPTPTMTPEEARGEIKAHMWDAADQHFEALAEWERVNKHYQTEYQKTFEKLEAVAKKSAKRKGVEYDPAAGEAEIRGLVWRDLEFGELDAPGQLPKAVLSLAVGVGLGKTEQAFKLIKYIRDTALVLLKADKSAAEANKLSDTTRIAYQRLTRAVLAVPTHKLADEAVERARGAGLSAGPFRGRLYEDKETGEHPMCEEVDSVQRCVDAGLPVEASMCRTPYQKCEFFFTCGYYDQLHVLSGCDVVVVPHKSLFHLMQAINSRGLLIIDEQFAFDGEQPRRALRMSELRKNKDEVYAKEVLGKLRPDEKLTKKLHQYREIAAAAVIESPDGNLSGRSMWELSASEVAEAIRLEWQTVVRSPVYPGMPRGKLLAVLGSAAALKRMRLRVDFWKALLALVSSDWKQKSGWLVRDTNADGDAIVRVGGRASIKDGWFDGLAVCLDATSSPELVQLYFPKHEIVAPPAIEAIQPNVTVMQTIDKAFSASMCIPVEGLEPDELKRRENRAREVYRFILLRASEFRDQGADGIDVLVICQQALEQYLLDLGLPDNVEVAHFNATRGIDRWGDVRCLMLIGRTLPPPVDVEVLTENLTGWAVEKVRDGNWYPRQSAGVDVGNGVGLSVQGEQHSDPMVEAVRWQICEAELIQCGGRGRGVNRSAETPLQLDVLSNVCLPMEVSQPVRWDDNAPGRIEEMVALGLLPDGPAAAAIIYSDLWPTLKTVKMAARNARAKCPKANMLNENSKDQLNGLSSLLNIYSRDLRPFSSKATTSPLVGSIETLVNVWGLKPLAFGALSRMVFAQARVERPDKRALKFKFLFDPHLIHDPESWLSERTGLSVAVEIFPIDVASQADSSSQTTKYNNVAVTTYEATPQ